MDNASRDRLEKSLKGANTSTLDALVKRIWRLPADRALTAIDLGVSLGSVSLRVALECLKAAPEIAQLVVSEDLRIWGDIGRRLATTNPDTATEFFARSGTTLEKIPAERRSLVLQICSRQAALSSRVALDTFAFAPVMIERIGDARLSLELLTICFELARHSVKHSGEFLHAAPEVVDHLRELEGGPLLIRRATALATSFAHRCGGTAADFFAKLPGVMRGRTGPSIDRLFDETLLLLERSGGVALQFFVAGGRVLHMAGPDAFDRWSDLSRHIAHQGNAASYHFLKFSPAVIADLVRRQASRGKTVVNDVLEVVSQLSETNPSAAIECFRAAPRALSTASVQQFRNWALAGIEEAGANARRAQAYYGLESRNSQDALRGIDGGLPLETVSNTLRLYIEGLTGREMHVASIQEVPEQANIGDGSTVYLPTVVSEFDGEENNFRLYKVLAAAGAGQIEFGTYATGTDEIKAAFIAVDERYRPEGASLARMPRDLNYAHALARFPNPGVARQIFTTIENARVDARLRASYRGLRRDLDFVHAALFAKRPDFADIPTGLLAQEVLLYAAFAGAIPEQARALCGSLVDDLENIFAEYVRTPDASVADSILATVRVYDLLVQQANASADGSSVEPLDEESTGEGDSGVAADASDPGRQSAKSEAMAGAQVSHWSQTTDSDIAGELEYMTAGTTIDAPEHALEAGDVVYPYDEWDRELGDHRTDWCRIIERRGARGSRTFVETVRSRYAGAISSIRNQFQLMRPENLRRVRGEFDGEDFDLEAVIDYAVDRRATGRVSERLYTRKLRRERDVAVSFLLDMSSSTARTISRYPNTPYTNPGRRIIDIEKEGLVLMSEALEAVGDLYAMHGFTSEGRRNVRFYVFKDFSESYSSDVEKRIGGISYQNNTRLGTAIRHSVAKLEAQDARTKLLIVLSDGRPYDHDYGDSRYAREDTKMALRLAKRSGVTPFCITIDRESEDQLKDMYGEVGYTIIDDVLTLPERMPAIYRRLTT